MQSSVPNKYRLPNPSDGTAILVPITRLRRSNMQSGIAASQELVSQFNTLLASDSHFGLLATIANEKLQPLQLLTSSSPGASFASNVTSLLTPHVKPNEALYIILRRHATTPALVAVTYVPDTAPIRQKMLFASTRLTLVRELGSEHFRDTIFATTAAELTPAGFEKHDAHTAIEAPLTEEEKTLGEVKRAEQEAGVGTGTREIHLSKSLTMPIAEDALSGLQQLGAGGGSGLVMLVCPPTNPLHALKLPTNDIPSLTENQPRHRKSRARSLFRQPVHNPRARPVHLRDRTPLHLLPLHTHPRRRRDQPCAVLLHMSRHPGAQGHQVSHDVPVDEAGRPRDCD